MIRQTSGRATTLEDAMDEPRLPKHPLRSPFPSECPESCNRNCKQFFEAHTQILSFALYATQNPLLNQRVVCAYAFSCGLELHAQKYELEVGEEMQSIAARAFTDLQKKFIILAQQELEDRIDMRKGGN